jgi:hypothetical protein
MAITRFQTSSDSARTAETSTDQHGNSYKRGRPFAALDVSEVVRLRDELGTSWRNIAKKLSADVSTGRRAYTRHGQGVSQFALASPRAYQNGAFRLHRALANKRPEGHSLTAVGAFANNRLGACRSSRQLPRHKRQVPHINHHIGINVGANVESRLAEPFAK